MYASIASHNDSVPIRQSVIISTSENLVSWRIYATLDHDELIFRKTKQNKKNHFADHQCWTIIQALNDVRYPY